MKINIKRRLSLVLSFVMIFSLIAVPAKAENKLTYDVNVSASTVVNDADHTVTISVNMSNPIEACMVAYVVTMPEGLELVNIATSSDSAVTLSTNNSKENEYRAYWDGDDDLADYSIENIGLITVKVPAGLETGTYTIDITGIEIYADESNTELASSDSLVVEITVEKPSVKADYEIGYTLDKVDSEDPADKFHEYGIGDEVVATVYLKNNTANAMTLQAYDIYLDYHEGLLYKSHTMNAEAYAEGKETVFNAEEDTVVDHIQAVSEGFNAVTLPANGQLELGTITFTIDSANTEVQYGTGLNIGFDVAVDATNSAKADDVTNFSVGSNSTGDKKSYYPVANEAVLGAEVNTTYTVTFDKNGGNGEMEKQTFQYGVAQQLTANAFSRDGWEFTGWNTEATPTDETPGTSYTDEQSVTNPGNITLYAQWEQNVFTVQWHDADGNVIEEAIQKNVPSGSKLVVTTETPAKEATVDTVYTFAGWSTNEGDSEVMNLDNYNVESDLDFYPVYTSAIREYTITFVDEDGTTVLKEGTKYAYGTEADKIGKPEDPTKTATAQYSYEFAGWDPEIAKVTADVTYKATYTEKINQYKVTYADDVTTTVKDAADYGTTITVEAAKGKTGYTFTGWTGSDGKTYEVGSTFALTGDITLTAQYTANSYTVKFDGNGGSGTMEDQNFTYDVAQKLAANDFKKENANFAGWKAPDGKIYTDGESVKNLTSDANGTVTLTAQWTNLYTVTFEGFTADQGTVTADPMTAAAGTEIKLNAESKAGYEFASFTVKDAEGNEVTVDDGKFIMPESNVIVTATFTGIQYSVTLNPNYEGAPAATTTTVTFGSAYGELEEPTREGYSFVGWYYDEACSEGKEVNSKTIVSIAENHELFAKWEAVEHDVNVTEPDNGTVEAPKTAKTDEEVTLIATPDTGYELDKYVVTYKDANGNDVTVPVTDGKFTMPAGDVTVTATFKKIEYTITVKDGIANGTVVAPDVATMGEEVALTVTPAEGYEVDKITVTYDENGIMDATSGKFTMPAANVTVDATFKKTDYTITIADDIEHGSVTIDKENNKAQMDDVVTVTATPAAGYELDKYVVTYKDANGDDVAVTVTDGKFTMPADDVTVSAVFKATKYTVTLNADGGTVADDTWTLVDGKYAKEYTIETGITLPGAKKDKYVFGGWNLSATVGGWSAGNYNAAEYKDNRYGDVELTAQWNRAASATVEQYKYAAAGQWMIIVEDTLAEGKVYKFGDQTMYYINDEAYNINGNGVYYTLIDVENLKVVDGKIVAELTDAAYEKLQTVDGDKTTLAINYNGDINGDGIVNIADANIVYQMNEQQSVGGYYTDLTPEQRLSADMSMSKTNAVYRGSIEDVDCIIDIINGTNPNS